MPLRVRGKVQPKRRVLEDGTNGDVIFEADSLHCEAIKTNLFVCSRNEDHQRFYN